MKLFLLRARFLNEQVILGYLVTLSSKKLYYPQEVIITINTCTLTLIKGAIFIVTKCTKRHSKVGQMLVM